MNLPPDDLGRSVRHAAYGVLIALSAGVMTGRLLAVNSVDRIVAEENRKAQSRADWQLQRPFLSSNDRSRWANIRSLVEYGTYEIDQIVSQPNWDTIDMVKHIGDDGRPHLYSSKPPLLATLIAGEYWVIHRLTGKTLETHPYEIGRFMLFTINVIPLLISFGLLARLAERYGKTDFGRIAMMGAATFGTFLTTFAVVLNNHLPGAFSVLVATYAALRIWNDGQRDWWYFVLAGLFAAFAAANELPALAFLAFLTCGLIGKAPRQTLLYYVPAAAVVVVAFFATNWIAHESLRPPYMHRSKIDPDDNWYNYSFERNGRTVDSYWRQPQGIDSGEESPAVYSLHSLVGHHGILSLTPIWLMSVCGTILMWKRREYNLRELAAFIAILSVIVVGFYLARPMGDRNYGGMTSGLRWVFWLTPLWLLAMLPAADAAANRPWARWVTLVLLGMSALSASYPTWNPWRHPWLANFFVDQGWIQW